MVRKVCRLIPIFLLSLGYPSNSRSAILITSPSWLPDGAKGEPYSFQLKAEGAVGEVTWSVDTGEMDYVEIETPYHLR